MKTKGSGDATFTYERRYSAAPSLVWEALTQAKHLQHWWGPVGMALRVIRFELEVGGVFHFEMGLPDGQYWYAKFVYREIRPTSYLQYVLSFSDGSGNIAPHPLLPSWPMETLITINLRAAEGETILSLSAAPLNANDEGLVVFTEGFASMRQGYGGTFDKLEGYLGSVEQKA